MLSIEDGIKNIKIGSFKCLKSLKNIFKYNYGISSESRIQYELQYVIYFSKI